MVLYTLFYIGQALAPNIQTLLVTRFFSGFFSIAPLTNCGGKQFYPLYKFTENSNFLIGVIADIWSAVGRGAATTLFCAGLFLGTVTGPIISG
jgi:DHA1 family multidrug resistance protein-like MFS transporter